MVQKAFIFRWLNGHAGASLPVENPVSSKRGNMPPRHDCVALATIKSAMV
jgi:hypothetical protein